ncbi:MAG TPA: HPr family phosphocarrier protein [Symbiobacteriaceae bacterium]|jgi:phosphocarrier protein
MIERPFTVTNPSGLHARPASLFVQLIQKFPGTEVLVTNGPRTVNARSLLSVLSLGVTPGTTISVRCAGPQETEAMEALRALIEGGFGE